jgi:hypothetical protein
MNLRYLKLNSHLKLKKILCEKHFFIFKLPQSLLNENNKNKLSKIIWNDKLLFDS